MLICADICGPWKPIWTRFLKVQLPVGPRTFWDRRWRAFDECSSPSASHSSHTYGKAHKNRKNSKIFGKFGTSPVELYVTSDGYKHIRQTVWVHTFILDHIYSHTVTFPGCRWPYVPKNLAFVRHKHTFPYSTGQSRQIWSYKLAKARIEVPWAYCRGNFEGGSSKVRHSGHNLPKDPAFFRREYTPTSFLTMSATAESLKPRKLAVCIIVTLNIYQ